MRPLTTTQANAVSKLNKYKVGALFMEAGTGKTQTAVELIKSVPNLGHVLWFAPCQTKNNLAIEIDKCGGLPNLEIVGIESLSNSDRLYLDLLNRYKDKQGTFVVCDESLKIKNFEAKRTRRIIDIAKLAEYKLILNGTAISKNLTDLWAQLEFLSPKILNMSARRFKNTFCEYTAITKFNGHKTIYKEFIKKYHNVQHLINLISPYIYEAELNLLLEKQYFDLSYELEEALKEQYTKLKEKYLDNEMMEFKNNNIFLEMTQKMQRLYACSLEKLSICDKIADDKTLIFCKFTNSRDLCESRYKSSKVLTYGKHSFGLNLQDYNKIIFFDKTWDYAQREQTEHRIYRTGQTDTCCYYDLTGDVGLETMINQNVAKKQDLLQTFKNMTVKELKEAL